MPARQGAARRSLSLVSLAPRRSASGQPGKSRRSMRDWSPSSGAERHVISGNLRGWPRCSIEFHLFPGFRVTGFMFTLAPMVVRSRTLLLLRYLETLRTCDGFTMFPESRRAQTSALLLPLSPCHLDPALFVDVEAFQLVRFLGVDSNLSSWRIRHLRVFGFPDASAPGASSASHANHTDRRANSAHPLYEARHQG